MKTKEIKGTVSSYSPQEKATILGLIESVIDSGHLMWGEMQERLQSSFCELTGRKYAVTFNSNTAAQEILFAFVKPRTVGFVGNQYPSPAFAAIRQGARVEWLDIDIDRLSPCLDPDKNLDMLVVQETAGFMPDWPAIEDYCLENEVYLVEDCGQSVGTWHGKWYDNRLGGFAGAFGDLAVFSLAGTKAMTAGGQGGLIVTDDEMLAEKLFELKNAGRKKMFTFDFTSLGYNAMMTEVQAAYAVAMTQTMVERTVHRAEIANVYDVGLRVFRRPGDRTGKPNWFKYPLVLPDYVDRALLRAAMADKGIQLASGVYDVPSYQMPALKEVGGFGVKRWQTEYWAAHHVCLPMHHEMTVEDAERVVEALIDITAISEVFAYA